MVQSRIETISGGSMSERTSPRAIPKPHERGAAVGILREQKAIDFAFQRQIHSVISEQRHAIGNPIFAHHVFGAHQPVAQNLEKSLFANLRRAIQVCRKRTHRFFVRFEK